MFRKVLSVGIAVAVFFTSTIPSVALEPAFDANSHLGLREGTSLAAFAYLKIALGNTTQDNIIKYGLALSAPSWDQSYADFDPGFHRPKALDLQLSGVAPSSIRLAGITAWQSQANSFPEHFRLGASDGDDTNTTIIAIGVVFAALGIWYFVCENERQKEAKDTGC